MGYDSWEMDRFNNDSNYIGTKIIDITLINKKNTNIPSMYRDFLIQDRDRNLISRRDKVDIKIICDDNKFEGDIRGFSGKNDSFEVRMYIDKKFQNYIKEVIEKENSIGTSLNELVKEKIWSINFYKMDKEYEFEVKIRKKQKSEKEGKSKMAKSSWFVKENMGENYLASKDSDYSIFENNGMHVAMNVHKAIFSIFKNDQPPIERSQSMDMYFDINGHNELIKLRQLKRKSLTYHLEYPTEVSEILKKELKGSWAYIDANKDRESGGKKQVIVPDHLREYIDFYKTNQPNTYRLEFITCDMQNDEQAASLDVDKQHENIIVDGFVDDSVDSPQLTTPTNPIDTLTYIHTYIKNKGFTYDLNQIKNFYLCLKSKPFTILSGISGTGKSKMVELFAAAIGATSENGRYNLIPVRPDWSDSSELIGYRNLNDKFIPGEITNIIKRAIIDKKRPYFICIDEMNLARVEYYFSDILSLMESRKMVDGELRTDTIIKDEVFGIDSDSRDEFKGLYIPQNVYIIGTVNMDETTFPFSRKVLDRAFTIEFNHVDLDFDFNLQIEEMEPMNIHNDFLKSEFNKIRDCGAVESHREIAGDIIERLKEINNILQKSSSQFAYRVRDEIIFYSIYAADGILTEKESLDLCIKQKILPRLQGNSEDILETLMGIYNMLNEEKLKRDNSFIDEKILESILGQCDISEYRETTRKIYSMIRRYSRDGFTTFWE